ncbi:SufE family protein [Candidatus Liberibacter brunswickensis]|uniref:SufE family protein n=1 Tax=Candidatus Liberibacter brunswickensis TaxID=1968796 RepID=UPI002FE2C4E0
MTTTIKEIIEDIDLIEDLEDRYHYLIELGEKLPPFPKEYMIDKNIVSACVSKLWMVIDWKNKENNDPIMVFYAVSDSQIVCGLLYIIKSIYDNNSINKILKIDSIAILQRLGLNEYISQKRTNGLYAIINKIHNLTKEYLDSNSKKS